MTPTEHNAVAALVAAVIEEMGESCVSIDDRPTDRGDCSVHLALSRVQAALKHDEKRGAA